MREFLKLDVVMNKVSKLLKKGNKVKTVIKAVTVSWTLFNIIAVIWSLIPKYETLDVNGDDLIEAVTVPESENADELEIVSENI